MSTIPPTGPSGPLNPAGDSGPSGMANLQYVFVDLMNSFFTGGDENAKVGAMKAIVDSTGDQNFINVFNDKFMPAYKSYSEDPSELNKDKVIAGFDLLINNAPVEDKADLNVALEKCLKTALKAVSQGGAHGNLYNEALSIMSVVSATISSAGCYSDAAQELGTQITNEVYGLSTDSPDAPAPQTVEQRIGELIVLLDK